MAFRLHKSCCYAGLLFHNSICISIYIYICMHVCMYVCLYVCMHVCMYTVYIMHVCVCVLLGFFQSLFGAFTGSLQKSHEMIAKFTGFVSQVPGLSPTGVSNLPCCSRHLHFFSNLGSILGRFFHLLCMFPGLRAHAARIANDHFISLDCAPNQESEEQSRWQLGDFNVGHINERACGMCLMCTCNRHAKKKYAPTPTKEIVSPICRLGDKMCSVQSMSGDWITN